MHFFGKGYHYKVLGLFPTNRHLFTVDAPNKVFLWGADSNGQDVFARSAARRPDLDDHRARHGRA